jgi:hypothetical protein
MRTTIQQAEMYFADAWNESRAKWISGDVSPIKMDGILPLPLNYYLTTLSRVVSQPRVPIKGIEAVKDRMRFVARDQFHYPTESTHITLLSCTQPLPSSDILTRERIENIERVCSKAITGRGVIRMTLRGVGIVRNQVLIQVFPHDSKWAEIRQELEGLLLSIGENPISYQDKIPIHMNIMRVIDNNPDKLSHILAVVEELREIEIGEIEISVVSFLISDLILSMPSTTELAEFRL